MDQQINPSNYVGKDEFSALREAVGVGFAQVNARMDIVHAELNGKIDLVHAELAKKMDVGFARLDARIDRATTTLLKWMFATQISVAAMFIAAIKYL